MIKKGGIKNDINSSFFNFLFGFIFIISISLGVVLVVNYYEISTTDLANAAAVLFLFK